MDLDERRRAGEAPRDYVKRVAEDKARAGWTRFAAAQGRPVLAADTAVVLGMRILGKRSIGPKPWRCSGNCRVDNTLC